MEKMPQNETNSFINEQGVEQPFSKEGLLNRNFGKTTEVQEEKKGDIRNDSENKPIIAQFIEAYKGLVPDAESAGFEAAYNKLDSSLNDEQKKQEMAKMRQEYSTWKNKSA